MVNISNYIANLLVENGTVKKEDAKLYAYGLHQLGVTILNVTTAILLGVVTGLLWQCVLFLLVYIPLRRFAGGYHARTNMRCYVASTLLLVCALWMIRIIPHRASVLLVFQILFGVAIFLMAPMGCKNKPLDAVEYIVYRERTRRTLATHIFGSCIAVLLSAFEIVTVIVVADALLATLLVLGNANKQADR